MYVTLYVFTVDMALEDCNFAAEQRNFDLQMHETFKLRDVSSKINESADASGSCF